MEREACRIVLRACMTALVTIVVLVALTASLADASAHTGTASCGRPSPIDTAPGVGGPEVIGSGSGARIWGLVQARRFPLVASDAVIKIVWRMTGSGRLKHVSASYEGTPIHLAWGPDIHGASNYARPGLEWGAGYRFTKPGCYRLSAERVKGSAVVWLRVAGRP